MNGVEKKTPRITQEDCDCARFLMRKGYTIKSIAGTLKCDPSTVSKIKTADFRLETYLENRKENNRKEKEKKSRQKTMLIDLVPKAETPEMLAGQMEMDLKPAKPEEKPEMSAETKMKRFLAGQIGEIVKALNGITEELKKLNESLHELRKE
jgi:IS30 family transposase